MADAPPRGVTDETATFRLERFEWAAPDRLQVVGRFEGLAAPVTDVALLVEGAGGARRLDGDVPPGAGVDGTPWRAVFVWRAPPIAFGSAGLEIADGVAVHLPAPGTPIDGDEPLAIPPAGPPEP